MTIRTHLLLLAFAAALPVLAFGLFVSIALIRYERETQRVGALDQARAMITAVDAELRGSISTLQALAATRAIATDDLEGFRVSAERVLVTQPRWRSISVSRPDGEQLVDVEAEPGAATGPAMDPRSLERVANTLQAQVGDVVTQPGGVAGIAVRVPILREGALKYVLTATVRPDSFEAIILQQRLPEGWVSGIVDREFRFVARLPRVAPGSLASPDFRAAGMSRTDGWYRGRTVEGIDTFTAHTSSQLSGWSIGFAIPTTRIEAAARRSVWLMGLGVVLSLCVTLLVTMIVGRRIELPVRSLALAARSLGSGGEARIDNPQRVRELADVASALQEAGAAVGERQRLLEREKDALQAADVAKNEFLAMLSHELRNPLAALTSAAHLLKVLDPAHPSAANARAVIERQTSQMTRLIEDLLDVSRITMGKATLDRKRFDLAEAVLRVVEMWRTSGRAAAHQLDLATTPVLVDADRGRIDQIVSNLLDNAVKFTPPGGRITVNVRAEEGQAVLRVADEGEGIPDHLVGRVFDLFVQGPRGMDRGKGGLGIGLALVKRLTEMHGGTVSVASGGAGKGAAFTIRLPAAAAAELRAPAPPGRAVHGSRRILIIEDNADARSMLREALRLNGHDVREAKDGQTGLAIAAEQAPEVVVIDIGLPDIDGYEVARRLHALMGGQVSLIALTGYGQTEDRVRARAAGFEVHLTKPVDLDHLEATIAGLTTERRAV